MHKKFRIHFDFSCSDNPKSKSGPQRKSKMGGAFHRRSCPRSIGHAADSQQPKKVPRIGYLCIAQSSC